MVGIKTGVYFIFVHIFVTGKLRRFSRYEDEISEGQLGINEKELNSMNKHIPGKFGQNLPTFI